MAFTDPFNDQLPRTVADEDTAADVSGPEPRGTTIQTPKGEATIAPLNLGGGADPFDALLAAGDSDRPFQDAIDASLPPAIPSQTGRVDFPMDMSQSGPFFDFEPPDFGGRVEIETPSGNARLGAVDTTPTPFEAAINNPGRILSSFFSGAQQGAENVADASQEATSEAGKTVGSLFSGFVEEVGITGIAVIALGVWAIVALTE
jgi:hypothetical protein